MKCGDKGHKTKHGVPCDQNISARAKGCLWHTRNAAQRRILAAKGSVVGRMKNVLPATYRVPPFDTRESIVNWARDMAGKVLRGELSPKLSAEARGHAQLALQARTAEAQERLVEALLTVEHGGSALLLLTRLQDGLADGRRRPLPGATRALPLSEENP